MNEGDQAAWAMQSIKDRLTLQEKRRLAQGGYKISESDSIFNSLVEFWENPYVDINTPEALSSHFTTEEDVDSIREKISLIRDWLLCNGYARQMASFMPKDKGDFDQNYIYFDPKHRFAVGLTSEEHMRKSKPKSSYLLSIKYLDESIRTVCDFNFSGDFCISVEFSDPEKPKLAHLEYVSSGENLLQMRDEDGIIANYVLAAFIDQNEIEPLVDPALY